MSAKNKIARSSIRARLIKIFTIAILIPSLVTAFVGVLMIREQVYTQAKARVTSDLEFANQIYQSGLDGLRDSLRIHATRMIIYGALAKNDPSELSAEMERICAGEGFDILTLTDTSGKVFYRTTNPLLAGDDQSEDDFVQHVLKEKTPISGTVVISGEELLKESKELADRAFMETAPEEIDTPSNKTEIYAGMVLKGAAPVFTSNGRFVGVLIGGVLLNRNYDLVDKIRTAVFKQEAYKGQELGTATIFQDDVRISTHVMNSDGSRAITTRVSAEIAEEVLHRNRTYHTRSFVVNDWYVATYAPIHDLGGNSIGMLGVGILERPYRDILWRNLYVFLGITLLAVIVVSIVAMTVAHHISQPIHAMADAARNIAEGDYSQKVEVSSNDEIGFLAKNFNRMVSELVGAHQELRDWGETLERKVEKRTAELKTVQAHLIQSEKLASVGKLAAGVAHEINNPLTCVLTNSSLILEDLPPDDPRREDLQTVVNETLRCRKIVKGLLDFARQTKPQKQVLSINKTAEDVLMLVRNQASFQNITIQTDLDPELPHIFADADQMRQVVLNIVLNAADAMSRGGSLRVRTHSNANHVELNISDTGPGIPEEIKDRLFEPFFTTKKTGTGLGLSIAYGILERHHGLLKVESSPGSGTTVTVVLPRGSDVPDD